MSFLAPIGAKLLVGLAIAGGVAAVLLGIRNGGKAAEKAEQMAHNAKVKRRQDAIIAPDPDDLDDLLRRL